MSLIPTVNFSIIKKENKNIIWRVEDLYNLKTLVGELLGAVIAVVWIAFAFLGAGNMVFLVVALAVTILLGTLSGGLIALSKTEINFKKLLGWLFGASIAVVWISYAILGLGNMVFLVVAISFTILLGVSSGGLIALSKKKNNYKEVIGWLLGTAIGVVWINFALLYGDTVSLVVAISLTILLGTLSGGLIALSKNSKTKEF